CLACPSKNTGTSFNAWPPPRPTQYQRSSYPSNYQQSSYPSNYQQSSYPSNYHRSSYPSNYQQSSPHKLQSCVIYDPSRCSSSWSSQHHVINT
ncbi:unnamed protein product, partial [Rotaria sordida]